METIITETQTLSPGYPLYLINKTATVPIVLTIATIDTDYQFFNLIRIDGVQEVVTIVLNNTLTTGEYTFNLHPSSNITLMSKENQWYMINGYTKDR